MAAHKVKESLDEIRDTFLLFDGQGDNKIFVEQVTEVVRALGLNPLEKDMKQLLKGYMAEDKLSFEEFVPIFHAVQTGSTENNDVPTQSIIDCINTFDREGNGYIHSASLKRILTGLGDRMTDPEVDELSAPLEDTSGYVNYEEFVRSVMSG